MRTGAAGGHHRFRDIDGALEGAADEHARARGFHRVDRIGFAESVSIELDAELGRQALEISRRIQSDGQHHHVEFFFFHSIIRRGISDRDILASRDFFSYRYVASDESNSRKLFRSLIKALEILSIGADIVVEYRALGIGVMIFRQNHLLLRIGAAYGGAIALAAGDDLP